MTRAALRVLHVGAVWFFFLGGLGMFFPFFSLYLYEGTRLSGTEVGIVVATIPLVGIVAQPLWGYVADRTGRRTLVLAFLATGAACGYAALGMPATLGTLLVATACLAFFSTNLMPSTWAVSLALVGDGGPRRLGWVRAAGTVGFGVSVASFPYLLRALRPEARLDQAEGLGLIFPLTGGLVLIGALLAFALPRTGAVNIRAPRGEYRTLLKHGPFLRVLVVTFFAFFFMQGPAVLFPLLVRAKGGGIDAISRMWLLMLSLEVPLILFFGWTVRRLTLKGVMLLGVLGGSIRWLVSGFVSDLSIVTAAQALHGIAVWGVVVCAPTYMDAVVPPSVRSTAQGALAMIGFGLGGVASTTLGGWLTDAFGATAPARWGGAGALLLGLVIRRLLPEPQPPQTLSLPPSPAGGR